MFATLRIGSDQQGPVCLESYSSPPGRHLHGVQQRSACIACRSKKLKCTGDKDGCARCRANGGACTYPTSRVGRRPRRQSCQRPPGDKQNSSPAGLLGPETSCGPFLSPVDSTMIIADPDTASSSPDLSKTSHGPLMHTDEMDMLDEKTARSRESPKKHPVGHSQVADLDFSEKLATDFLGIDFDWMMLENPPSIDEQDKLQNFSMTDSDPQFSNKIASPLCDAPADTTMQLSEQEPCLPTNSHGSHSSISSLRSDSFSQSSSPCWHQMARSYAPRLPPRTPCQCLQKVVSIHEEVESKHIEDKMMVPDYRLSFQRGVLKECNTIIQCEECSKQSAIIMMLITICKRLLASFDILCDVSPDKLRCPSRPHQRRCPELSLRGNKNHAEIQKVYSDEFGIESPHDQWLLMLRVVEIQLRALRGLLARLKNIALSNDLERHIMILYAMDEQAKQIAADLREAAESVLESLHGGCCGSHESS